MMMVPHREMENENDEQQAPEGEQNLDRTTQQVQNLFNLKNFYD